MKTSRIAVALATVVLAGGAATATVAHDGNLHIGLEAPLTGPLAELGDGMLKGAQMAAAQLNEAGGLLGQQVEIVPIDDGGDKTIGVPAVQAAIANDELAGVVGPYNSGVGIKTLPLYLDAGIMPIHLTSDNSTSGLGYTLQPKTYQIAPVAAQAITDWLGGTKVAIIYDGTQNYSVGIAQALQTALTEAGVTIAAYDAIQPGQADYGDEVATALGFSPDVIYADVYAPEGALIAKAIAESGSDVQCLMDYATFDDAYITNATVPVAQRCPVVGVPAPGDFMGAEAYVQSYTEMFGEAPGAWSPYTYDSVKFLAAGITGAGSTEMAAVKPILDAVDGWTGWTGEVTIDPATGDRNPATVVVASVSDDGEFHVDMEWAEAVEAPF